MLLNICSAVFTPDAAIGYCGPAFEGTVVAIRRLPAGVGATKTKKFHHAFVALRAGAQASGLSKNSVSAASVSSGASSGTK